MKDPITVLFVDDEPAVLRFEGVHFAYDEKHRVLNGIDLEVRRGETVALVGGSGGGKTTLVNLVPRFFDPTEGRLTLDGTAPMLLYGYGAYEISVDPTFSVSRLSLATLVVILAGYHHVPFRQWLSTGSWPLERSEFWELAVDRLNAGASSETPILLCPALVEDRRLARPPSAAEAPESLVDALLALV